MSARPSPSCAVSRACGLCAAALDWRNTSGYCRGCFFIARWQDPAFRAAHSEGLRRKYQADPVFAEQARARARAASQSPAREAALARLHAREGWRAGLAAMRTPEARAKAGKAISRARMAWCPPHLIDLYRHLIRTKRLRADEARAVVLAQDAAEVAAVRRRMGG